MRATALAWLLLVSSCAATPPLQVRAWYWLGTLDKLSVTEAPEPERYTLQFHDGRAAVRADCNRGTSAATLEGDRVSFGPMAMTRAFCPPPSRGDEYARQLQSAARFSVHGDVLRLELKDGGAMFFAADAKARIAHYRCRDEKMQSVVYAGEAAQVWFDGAHYALARERTASGARYADGSVTFDTKGVVGSLRKGDAFLAQNCQLPSR
ncbi:MAG: META domain-containing protein [Betaproteobacteria bacterium]|nr:META domain-containing protein [Betaproteobacteria bacterium]MDH5221898.1 META domain-containing protein [Betaproteobacteria bacterium]MDH5352166.1 META domain-containing protein [Betaproteobacteria bacterium]